MDGSTSTFLYDAPLLSSRDDDYSSSILYVEDFDCQVQSRKPTVDEGQPPLTPSITQADLEQARAEGHAEGSQSALADVTHLRAQLETAAIQSLGESLAAARVVLDRVATHHAAECARATLTILLAAVPATMNRNGVIEVQAILDALVPGLTCEPELRVRAHPDLADIVRERLVAQLPSTGIVLSVVADSQLECSDVEVSWQQGQARRDCKTIWAAIKTAMAPVALPTVEEVYLTHGN